jgi:hypothetical protein
MGGVPSHIKMLKTLAGEETKSARHLDRRRLMQGRARLMQGRVRL